MTVQTQILRGMNNSFQTRMTNREIADTIGRPEATVRRETRMLVEAKLLRVDGTWGRATDYTLTTRGILAASRS